MCIFLSHKLYSYKEPKTNNTLRLKAKKQLMEEFFTQEIIDNVIKDYSNLEHIYIPFNSRYDEKIENFAKSITIYYGIYDTYNDNYYNSGGEVYSDIEKCVYKFIKNNVLLNFPLVKTKTSRRGIKLEVKY